jgi:DNA-binding NtrC family response regulator
MGAKGAILILVDEANLRRSLALVLERAGFAVRPVTYPQEAFDSLQSENFCLALLDLKNAETEYPRILPAIHRLFPEMPVLILVTGAQPGDWAEHTRLRKQSILNKPVDAQTLLGRVIELLAENGGQVVRDAETA